jgi:hypothetical protein
MPENMSSPTFLCAGVGFGTFSGGASKSLGSERGKEGETHFELRDTLTFETHNASIQSCPPGCGTSSSTAWWLQMSQVRGKIEVHEVNLLPMVLFDDNSW